MDPRRLTSGEVRPVFFESFNAIDRVLLDR